MARTVRTRSAALYITALFFGFFCCFGVYLDAFQTIILPRRPTGRLRITPRVLSIDLATLFSAHAKAFGPAIARPGLQLVRAAFAAASAGGVGCAAGDRLWGDFLRAGNAIQQHVRNEHGDLAVLDRSLRKWDDTVHAGAGRCGAAVHAGAGGGDCGGGQRSRAGGARDQLCSGALSGVFRDGRWTSRCWMHGRDRHRRRRNCCDGTVSMGETRF